MIVRFMSVPVVVCLSSYFSTTTTLVFYSVFIPCAGALSPVSQSFYECEGVPSPVLQCFHPCEGALSPVLQCFHLCGGALSWIIFLSVLLCTDRDGRAR